MDEFEKNEMNAEPSEAPKEEVRKEQPSESGERNTNAPSGWTYSANTNQYVSWDGSADENSARWNPGNPAGEQQPPRREYGTRYGYYGNPQTNYYSNSGENYQWDFNKYESAEAGKKTGKKGMGKGLKVFLAIVGALLAVCIVSLSSIGIYRMLSGENRISSPISSVEKEETPNEVEVPDISLHDIPKENTVTTDGKLSATEIYKKVSPSVVGVVQYQYSYSLEAAGSGSGIIISDDGYIVTNAHVIEGAEAVKVVLYNEEEYEAEVIGSDIQTDIAVLKIDAENLVEVELGDSSQLEIGETVYALGNPGGLSLQSSFTDGMISGLDRVINVESSYYMSVIQTSAAINPGNSGGALINEYGQVVGITSAKIISTDYEGIGFAIPTETAKPLIEDIIKNGYVSGRAMIGINVITIDSVTARYYDVPEGVQIIEINPDGSLYGTEVKVGDIITHFDGKNVTCVEDLHEYLTEHVPGDKVVMEFYRYSATGKSDFSYTVEVELKESKG